MGTNSDLRGLLKATIWLSVLIGLLVYAFIAGAQTPPISLAPGSPGQLIGYLSGGAGNVIGPVAGGGSNGITTVPCAGVDDTAVIQTAVAAGGTLIFPSNCKATTLHITNIQTGEKWTQGKITFTGTPVACSNSTGGLLQIFASHRIQISGMQLIEQNTAAAGQCFINLSGAHNATSTAQVEFDNDFVSAPTNSAGIAVFSSNVNIIQWGPNDVVDDFTFGQWWVEDTVENASANGITISGQDRFGPQTFAQQFNYAFDFNSTTAAGTQGLVIDGVSIEQGPNLLRVAKAKGIKLAGTGVYDSFAMSAWLLNTAEGANSCVLPVAAGGYASIPFIFCTQTSCLTTNGVEPIWNQTPGATTTDNTCTWTNEGAGVVFDLKGTGAVLGNQLQLGGAIGVKLEYNGTNCGSGSTKPCPSAWDFAGNFQVGGSIRQLWDMASGATISGNTFYDTSLEPVINQGTTPGKVIIGDAATVIGAVSVGDNLYVSDPGNAGNVKYFHATLATGGNVAYDTNLLPAAFYLNDVAANWTVSK